MAALVALTWSNWWLDARLAGPAHAIDIAVFTLLVFVTQGYTSPYIIFFVFLLLAAAIRWGWKETALTAILLTVLYLGTGLLTASGEADFNTRRFLVRSAQLIIVALIVMWFGANQWRARFVPRAQPAGRAVGRQVANRDRADGGDGRAGRGPGRDRLARGRKPRDQGARHPRQRAQGGGGETAGARRDAAGPLLYDVQRDRALTRDAERNLRSIDPCAAIGNHSQGRWRN